MTITIEDGSIVAGANSFVTVAEVRTFATERGVNSLPTDDLEVEALIIKSMDYLFGKESSFKGVRAVYSQELPWPRAQVYLREAPVGSNEIPVELKKAQMQLVLEAVSQDLDPNGAGREVIREKVDVVEVQYNPTGNSTVRPRFHKVDRWLEPLMKSSSFGLRSVRV